MDVVGALLAEARAAGLRVEAVGDALKVDGPMAAAGIVQRLREAKPAILDRLRGALAPDASASLTRSDAFTENEFIPRAHGGISENTRQDASAAPMRQPPVLDLRTLREVLGPDAVDPHAVACIRFDVLAAVREIEAGIETGVLPRRRLVRGRPLADWLDLADVARLLRAWRDRGAR
ncbi:MAG: hypothetical protein ACREVS_06105 [Burkholderiales bacterium]